MSLEFIQTLKNEINSLLPDNNTGQITPAILRGVLQDMADSLYSRGASLFRSSATPVAQALTTTPTNYPAIYDTLRALDPPVVAGSLVAGTVTPAVTGFACSLTVSMTVDGAVNRIVTAQSAKNGVQIIASRIIATCTGAGNKVSATITIPIIGVVASDVFTLLLSVDTGASINVSQQVLSLAVNPTFSTI